MKALLDKVKHWLWDKDNIKLSLFIAAITLFFGLAFILSEFNSMPNDGLRDTLVMISYWLYVEIGVFGLLLVLCLNKWIFAITFPLLMISCGVMTYFRYAAHAELTPSMIDLLVVNDLRTDIHAISWLLVVVVLACIILSAVAVYYRFRKLHVRNWYVWLTVGLLMVYVVNNCIGTARVGEVQMRMPFSFYYNIKEYMNMHQTAQRMRPEFKGDVRCKSDSLTVVFIQGESLRADHLQINGYHRATTPRLMSEENVVSLPHVISIHTLTHLSIPHILTRADSLHQNRAYEERSFISLLKQAGYRTYWLTNQESGPTYIYFMKECHQLKYAHPGSVTEKYDAWLDGDLLPLFDDALSQPAARRFILLHTIGSHWFYNAHFNKQSELFTPLSTNRVVRMNSEQKLCNSYDNTIVYSDWFWQQLINRLRKQNAMIIYLSDHGESLGENGEYWHGKECKEHQSVASFVWYSDEYARRYPEKINALKQNKNRHIKTDFLFHSILDAAGVESSYVEPLLDVFFAEQPLQ